MADTVEEIKARLSIVDVVSQYVQLKKAGNSYKGLCPFHSEKTPSFVVSLEKQICHCFGCGKGGDIFTVVQELEGVGFSDALDILADRAGVKIEKVTQAKARETKSEKDEYYAANELACDFFIGKLKDTNDGKKVIDYLHRRGLKDDTIDEFRIGFAPDSYEELNVYLQTKGVSKTVLHKSGLVSAKNLASDQVYDKFRGRLMFPIFNQSGKICGFGGRALKADQMPKYLNSPENVVYNKSEILYGLDKAKLDIKKEDSVILVEGYFDMILPFQEGVRNVVATCGTALTSKQAKQIKRFTSNVVASFDNDGAGFEATKRAYVVLKAEDISVKAVENLSGKDPADQVREDSAKFIELIKGAHDFVIFLLDKLARSFDGQSFEGRNAIMREILPFYKEMSGATKDMFVRELASRLKVNERALYDEIDNLKLPVNHPARKNAEAGNVAAKFTVAQMILSIVLEHGNLFKILQENLQEKDFEHELKEVYKALCDQYNSAWKNFERWDFEQPAMAALREKIDLMRLYAEDRYGIFSEVALESELLKLIDKHKEECRKGVTNWLHEEIIKAENANDKERLLQLLREQQEILSS